MKAIIDAESLSSPLFARWGEKRESEDKEGRRENLGRVDFFLISSGNDGDIRNNESATEGVKARMNAGDAFLFITKGSIC